MKRALITGITGQDGSYLARYLLSKGYEVHGIKRRSSSFNTGRIDDIVTDDKIYEKQFFLHFGDVTDTSSVFRIIQDIYPDEVYNLAAQSHVHVSFETPEYTANVDGLGAIRILEAIKSISNVHECRFYQASSSEIFGISQAPQNEDSMFQPQSPYASAKLFAYWITKNYRDAYDLFACNGILFNHESPVRGETFVTRKIVRALTKFFYTGEGQLVLGNLEAIRDWGHAKEYVVAMWLMMNHIEPLDLVIASGRSSSVRNFVNLVANELGLNLIWTGVGINETATDETSGKPIVKVNSHYFRPNEVPNLLGNASKARELLGWYPQVTLEELVKDMVDFERKNYF